MTKAVSAYIALGANLGDRLKSLQSALDALEAAGDITIAAISALYETAPVGGPDAQGAYYNAVIRIETPLPPLLLLDRLQQIEAAHHRTRDVHWGPRTLDLDLLFYADVTLADARLTLPHPRLHERRFVLAPLADVGADHPHPKLQQTVAELLHALPSSDADDVIRAAENWRHAP